MDFFTLPFELSIYDDNFYQKHSLIRPQNLFSNNDLEMIIERVIFNNIGNRTNIAGIAGEYIAQKLYDFNMTSYLNKLISSEGKFVDGKVGYLINNSEKYLAKLIGKNRIVILRKEKSYDIEKKFGFKNVAEIDGLYQVKKNKFRKNMKKYIAMEIKTGNSKMKAKHILQNIIIPLKKMYKVPICYTLIGFKDEIYKDSQKNILNRYMAQLAENLFISNVEFTFMHFPFNKVEFNNFVEKIENKVSNTVKGKAIYYKNNDIVEIEGPNGIIRGKFVEI